LLAVDIDELHLLGMHLLNPIDGGVVEDVGPVRCFGKRSQVFLRISQ
jgi:hypothetical protein